VSDGQKQGAIDTSRIGDKKRGMSAENLAQTGFFCFEGRLIAHWLYSDGKTKFGNAMKKPLQSEFRNLTFLHYG
jgi:hypothetical protein